MKTPPLVNLLVLLKLAVFVGAVLLELYGHLNAQMTGVVMTVIGSLGLTSAIHSMRAPTSQTDALNELMSAGTTTFLTQYLSSVMSGSASGGGSGAAFPPAAPPAAGGMPFGAPPAPPTSPNLPPDPAAHSAAGARASLIEALPAGVGDGTSAWVPPLRSFGARRLFIPSGLAALCIALFGCNAAQKTQLEKDVTTAESALQKTLTTSEVLCLVGTHVPGLSTDVHAVVIAGCAIEEGSIAGAETVLQTLDKLAFSTAKPTADAGADGGGG